MTQMQQKKDKKSAWKNPHNSTEKKGRCQHIVKGQPGQNLMVAPFCSGIANQSSNEHSMELSNGVYLVDENQMSYRVTGCNKNGNTVKFIRECSFNTAQFERPQTEMSKN